MKNKTIRKIKCRNRIIKNKFKFQKKKEESIISDYKDINNNYNNLNTIKVDEIISDVEINTSNLFSVNTSMLNLSNFNNNDGSYIRDKFLKGNENSLKFNLENLKKKTIIKMIFKLIIIEILIILIIIIIIIIIIFLIIVIILMMNKKKEKRKFFHEV